MSAPEETPQSRPRRKWGVGLFLLGVAIFFYISIMYKIVHFGA
jgi:hypothetical protein